MDGVAVMIKKSKNPMRTVSHWMLFAICMTYFVAVALGCFVVIFVLTQSPEYAIQAFSGLLGFVGTATTVTIGFYSWKAKAENTARIKANQQESAQIETERQE